MTRQNISSGAKWEAIVGYSRAVRLGPWVMVSGTTSVDEGGRVVSPGNAYAQAVFALRKIEAALDETGARLSDVVRTRIFLTHINDWQAVGRAHAEFFGEIRPASTLVQVAGLVDPQLLVEIEADAIVADTA